MSAWLCSQDHINLIVNASDCPSKENFNMLVQENLKSLRARYPGRDFLKDWEVAALAYVYEEIEPKALVERVYAHTRETDEHISKCYPATLAKVTDALVGAQVATSCRSYAYQAYEHGGWEKSKARKFVVGVEEKFKQHASRDRGCLWSF